MAIHRTAKPGLIETLLATMLAVHAALLVWSASRQSPTLNEPAHLVAGISHWRFGRFELYRVNPPLVRMVAALPVLAAGYEEDWSGFYEAPGARPVFSMGEHFVTANGQRSIWLMTLARWAVIPLSLAGAVVCFFWARDLYGNSSGLLAAASWCFSPSILGHAQFITPDTGAAALSLAACYVFWRWLRSPSWNRALLAGVALGMALLTKFTVVLVALTWTVLWVFYRWSGPRWQKWSGHAASVTAIGAVGRGIARRWIHLPSALVGLLREAAMLTAIFLVALYVLNAGYGFEGPLPKLRDIDFVSHVFRGGDDSSAEAAESRLHDTGNRFRKGWLGNLRVPVPRNYLVGMDVQQRDFESSGRKSYLRGAIRSQGWWYYYLYAVAVKAPLGAWLLALVTVAIRLAGVRPYTEQSDGQIPGLRDELVVLAPAVSVFIAVSSQTSFNQHLRYVLPAFPFLYVWIGQVAALASRRGRILSGVVVVLATWSIASSLWIYPHTLSYFNELAGGPAGGHRHLVHSNIDWGQDLLYLGRWIKAHPEAHPVHLAYFGTFDPRAVGFADTLPVNSTVQSVGVTGVPAFSPGSAREESETQIGPHNLEEDRWYAVSVNLIYGGDGPARDGPGQTVNWNSDLSAVFRRLRPVESAGYSIHIFRVPAGTMDTARGSPQRRRGRGGR